LKSRKCKLKIENCKVQISGEDDCEVAAILQFAIFIFQFSMSPQNEGQILFNDNHNQLVL